MSLLRLWFGTSVTAICFAWYADELAASLRAADELWAAGDKAAEKVPLTYCATEDFAKDDTRRARVPTAGSVYLSGGTRRPKVLLPRSASGNSG
jgi:hypothetical protein